MTNALRIMGLTALLVGIVVSIYNLLRQKSRDQRILNFRRDIGHSILLSLEFLVAADIVTTTSVAHSSWDAVGLLAAIVLIRTFLSFSLEIEINQRWPWQKA